MEFTLKSRSILYFYTGAREASFSEATNRTVLCFPRGKWTGLLVVSLYIGANHRFWSDVG